MTMPNKMYELRKLYFQQSQYTAKQVKPDYPPLLQWPEKGLREKFKLDTDLPGEIQTRHRLAAKSTFANSIPT